MTFEVTTDQACIDKMLHALPFAETNAGLDETATLIRMLVAERDKLRELLARAVEGPWSDSDLKEARKILAT